MQVTDDTSFKWNDLLKKYQIQFLFVGFVFIGALFIFYMSNDSSKGIWTTPVIITILIILYIIWTTTKKIHLKTGVIDTYYYLGFIFTLISMISAFYSHSQLEGMEESSKISILIAHNGVALVSTVVGMVGRLVVKMSIQDQPNNVINYNYPTREEIESYVYLVSSIRETASGVVKLIEVAEQVSTANTKLESLNENLEGFTANTISLESSIQDSTEGLIKLREAIISTSLTTIQLNTNSKAAIKALDDGIKNYENLFQGIREKIESNVHVLVEDILNHIHTINPKVSNLENAHEKLLELYAKLNQSILDSIETKNNV